MSDVIPSVGGIPMSHAARSHSPVVLHLPNREIAMTFWDHVRLKLSLTGVAIGIAGAIWYLTPLHHLVR